MADLNLTDGDDTFEYAIGKPWVNIKAMGGNDKITIHGNAKVLGGPGNDIITNDPFDRISGGAVYWESPSAIYVDLEAGYALDGYGTRDTLINIRDLDTSGRDGDVVLGSSKSDSIWLNGFNWTSRQPGKATLDLRGGIDTVNFHGNVRADFQIDISADGKILRLQGKNGYSAELTNVEVLRFREALKDGTYIDEFVNVRDLIDFSKVGAATLINKPTDGWSNGSPKSMTFSFMSAAPTYGGGEGGTGFVVPNDAYKLAVNVILGRLWLETGLSFTEVPDTATSYGQLRFGANQQTATKGYAFIPGQTPDARAGDVWLDVETLQFLGQGQEGWEVLLHEIGHALGLSHPIPESTVTTAPVLLNGWNDNSYTVMSSFQSPSKLWQSWFGALDIQALQSLYGAGRPLATGNDDYLFGNSQGQSLSTLRDAGGSDWLNLSANSLGAYVDMKPGSFSSIGITTQGYAAYNNVFIDPSTTLENIIGTPYDDVIFGNDANNLIHEWGGNDVIDGRGGINTVAFVGKRSEYNINPSEVAKHWLVEGKNGALGSDDLTNIKFLQFADSKVILDVAGNPTTAAKLIGTILGGSWVSNLFISGLAMGILDNGFSPVALARLGLESPMFVGMAGSASNKDFYNLVHKNVYGVLPDAQTLQSMLSQLDGNQTTQADVVLQLADTAQNKLNIDLVGIQLHGFEFTS
jgi:hypothetical protein